MITTLRNEFDFMRQLLTKRDGAVYRDAQYLSARFEVDPDKMNRWLAPGMRMAKDPVADLFIASFPDSFIGVAYLEAGLFVHVRTPFGAGIHCPWMLCDNDMALIIGREGGGYPKKFGEFDYVIDGDTVFAQARRNGVPLLTMTGTLGKTVEDPEPFIGKSNFNVVGTEMSIPRVIWFKPIERPTGGTRDAVLDVEINGTVNDPLHEMGLGQVLSSRLNRLDLLGLRPGPLPVYPLAPTYTLANFRIRTT